MGNAEFSDFDSLSGLDPPPEFDSLLHTYASTMGINPTNITSSPWTDRAFNDEFYYSRYCSVGTGKKPAKRTTRPYKRVDQKVRPVPTYFPDPRAQEFKEIPPAVPLELPVCPPDYHSLDFSGRVTLERLEVMLAKIEPGMLTPDKINLTKERLQ